MITLRRLVPLAIALCISSPALASRAQDARAPAKPSERLIQQLDELSALWSFYKRLHLRDGRVVSWDEGGITTSEGQSYAMLRAAWQNDRQAFQSVWTWTRENLQTRKQDKLFSWKWKGRVLDANSATDADTDIALALLIASTRFSEPRYQEQALEIMADIWRHEVVQARDGTPYISAGNWAPHEDFPTIHVAYLAPYAYDFFAGVDQRFPWKKLVQSSYRVLHYIYDDQHLKLPPELVYLDKSNGTLHLQQTETGKPAPQFSYDAFPIFWRVAVDAQWYSRAQKRLRRQMLAPFQEEWNASGRFWDRYGLDGTARSRLEGLPLYATVHALALTEDRELADRIRRSKLDPLWQKALTGRDTPYYLQNWIWFDRALELNVVRTYTEFLGFLRPFDFESFSMNFPWLLMGAVLVLFAVSRFHRWLKLAFLAGAFALCGRYLYWRLFNSLNFLEPSGPPLSIALWIAEAYCFSTVALLVVQVGLSGGKKPQARPQAPKGFEPSVDIFIPIYSESLEILEKTLIAARAIRYGAKRIHVCDDSHRDSVRAMAEEYGASYFPGPKRHAKAGNLNNAISKTSGELLLIFDTDHIPVGSFLEETVPYFADPKIGFIQTPHHFYNEDIFQRAFGTGLERVPDEQDMFNHAIQSGRHHWNGAFFVGSGAVFRRVAIEELGGFKLMSITEDIHTSQHLHAAGWRSAFVDKDLAVGLTAENLASFIVQRRRWMLGCLQIFFKDNPLFCRGLTLRQRIGYFASLYYFLYPISRVIFWATPLAFLLFQGHPIFSEVSILMAYLIPYMILLPLISSALLPGWPRMLWGVAYEVACSFVLARSMFDLFLPKNLGFKVTPKGITSERRSFDWSSAKVNLAVAAITVFALGKGLFEFYAFGIEKDAYFFNIAWALINLLMLGVSLLVAWEKPQRRTEDRMMKPIPYRLSCPQGLTIEGQLHDISLGGVAILARAKHLPVRATLTLEDPEHLPLTLDVERVHQDRRHAGYKFIDLKKAQREQLLLMTFASESTWANAHKLRIRGNAGMAWAFLAGIANCLKPARAAVSNDSADIEPRDGLRPGLATRIRATRGNRKKHRLPLAAIFLSLTLTAPDAHAAIELKKSWYMSRGKSNMEIGNYKAAIEAYEKVLEEDPDNTEAMRSLGIAYESQGFKDKAIAQYDRYLEKNPRDAEIAFRQAEALEWSRYSYRRKDALKYYAMGLRARPDNQHRLKYARLLAANQETNDEAIAQYRAVLRSNPKSGEAHSGLARAYAWNGQNDKAVYHSQLAKQYGASRGDLKELDRDLHQGRESIAGGDFVFLTQPGGGYDLSGFQFAAVGQTELGAFVTFRARAGFEDFWHTGDQPAVGGLISLGAQYRIDESQSLDLGLGYRSIAPMTTTLTRRGTTYSTSAAGANNIELKAEYRHQGGDGFTIAPGFERTLRKDSYQSLVGTVASGAARSNLFRVDLAWEQRSLALGLKPSLGWVTTLGLNPNIQMGVDGLARVHLVDSGDLMVDLGNLTQLAHYDEDQSDPTTGGYFSPQFYVNEYPHLGSRIRFTDRHDLELTAGPTLQWVQDLSVPGAWQVGANVSVAYQARITRGLQWRLGASYAKVSNRFNQLQIDNFLSYAF